mmetsp:Transcript_30040/g.96911  ORF Transcript_30040/g.96911 Transcript_30040/m.96911 type:complete len:331 (+) Transcript_30040:2239-3231(+)
MHCSVLPLDKERAPPPLGGELVKHGRRTRDDQRVAGANHKVGTAQLALAGRRRRGHRRVVGEGDGSDGAGVELFEPGGHAEIVREHAHVPILPPGDEQIANHRNTADSAGVQFDQLDRPPLGWLQLRKLRSHRRAPQHCVAVLCGRHRLAAAGQKDGGGERADALLERAAGRRRRVVRQLAASARPKDDQRRAVCDQFGRVVCSESNRGLGLSWRGLGTDLRREDGRLAVGLQIPHRQHLWCRPRRQRRRVPRVGRQIESGHPERMRRQDGLDRLGRVRVPQHEHGVGARVGAHKPAPVLRRRRRRDGVAVTLKQQLRLGRQVVNHARVR